MEPDRLASGESGDILVWTCVDLLTGDTAKSLQLGTGGVQGHRGTGAPDWFGRSWKATTSCAQEWAALLHAGAVPGRRPEGTGLTWAAKVSVEDEASNVLLR